MEWKDLEKMTVTKLREEALKHPDQIKGVHGKGKAQIMEELAHLLGIPKPHVAFTDKVVQTKESLKHRIHDLKTRRDRGLAEHNHKELKLVRREIHKLKRQIRKIEHQDTGKAKP
jgi:hypothetical protein